MCTIHANRRKFFEDHIVRHADSLLRYTQSQGYPVNETKKLLIVTGISRAQDYFALAYQGREHKQFDFSVSVGDGQSGLFPAGGRLSVSGSWGTDPTIFTASGPSIPEATTGTPTEYEIINHPDIYKQSVFIWTSIVQRRRFRMRASAGYYSPPLGESKDDHYDTPTPSASSTSEGQSSDLDGALSSVVSIAQSVSV
jgi:hypothetical protein